MSTPPTEDELRAWRKLAEEATEGPWIVDRGYDGVTGRHVKGRCSKRTPHGPGRGSDWYRECATGGSTEILTTDSGVYTHNEADLDFIAQARTALPRLLDEVEALREMRAKAIAALRQCGPGLDGILPLAALRDGLRALGDE